MVSDDHGMLPSMSAKLIRRKVCEKNSVFCCVLAVEMLQDGKPTLIYAIVARNLKKILQKRTLWDITSAKMTLEETKKLLKRTKQCQTVIMATSARAIRAMPST